MTAIQVPSEVQAAILTGLAAALPGINVMEYPAYTKRVPLPCICLELESFHLGDDPGTGQLGVRLRFEARAIVDPVHPHAQRAARDLCALVARAVRGQVWGLPIGAAEFAEEAAEDSSKPELDGLLVWMLPWQHHANLGPIVDWQTTAYPLPAFKLADYPESLIPDGAIPVRTVLIGTYPDTGIGNAQKYINPQPPGPMHGGNGP